MVRLFALALLIAAVATTTASAHLERPSYWPDPAPDNSVSPPAGGKVPKARSLASAVTGKGPGEVRVVCQKRSLAKALASIRSARKQGFRLRPSQPVTRYSKKKARKMRRINRALKRQLRVPLDSGRRERLRQQRSRRDHAGPLHGAEVAQGADQRQALQPLDCSRTTPAATQTPSYEYQVDLPERPEPDLRPGPRGQGRAASRRRGPTARAFPEQELGGACAATSRSRARAPKPEDVIIDAGKDYENPRTEAAPRTAGRTAHAKPVGQARGPAYGPR